MDFKNCKRAHIEIEDLDSVTLSGLSGKTLLSPTYSVPVATVDQKYLIFQFEGIQYMFAIQMNMFALQEFSLNSRNQYYLL